MIAAVYIHQRLFPLAKAELQEARYYLNVIGRHLILMGRRGALPILRFLRQLDIPAKGRVCSKRRRGTTGRRPYAELEPAARAGNPAAIQLLVRYCNGYTSEESKGALRIALEKEHIEAARVLLSS
ncbi:hypothetical protein PG985_009924 [Apiospora marii]|uniref:uncharacterized protein n=1 Tax=Apiospora marii TaxID=335849 RepID=UPI003130E91F